MNKSKILSKGKREAQKNELTVTTTERRWDSRRATKIIKIAPNLSSLTELKAP